VRDGIWKNGGKTVYTISASNGSFSDDKFCGTITFNMRKSIDNVFKW
jgi:hypothetical protein